jgi:hypothetical protein
MTTCTGLRTCESRGRPARTQGNPPAAADRGTASAPERLTGAPGHPNRDVVADAVSAETQLNEGGGADEYY